MVDDDIPWEPKGAREFALGVKGARRECDVWVFPNGI